MTPYQLHDKAHFEFIESYQWYELRQQGLGERFSKCVEERLFQISNNPEFYPKKHGNFREVKVKGFPYSIVYELFKKNNLIHIAAIYHNKRNPKQKFRKV